MSGPTSRTVVRAARGASASAPTPSGAEQRPAVAAEQARGQEQRERVDEALADQAGGELGAALDQQRGDLARRPAARSASLQRRRRRARSTPGGRRRRAGRGHAQHGRRRRRVARASCRPRSRPRRSNTTRSGWRSAGGSASRGSSSGSSASAVPLPTATASNRARQSCTSRRLSGEEIQRLSPLARGDAAVEGRGQLEQHVRPAVDGVHPERRVLAARPRLDGAPRQLDLDAGLAQPREALPADLGTDRRRRTRRGRCRPRSGRRCRAAGGRGGCTARARRRPWRPAAARCRRQRDASRRAARRGRSCQPSPSTRSSRAMTQPTTGFGLAVRRPRSASSSVRSSSSASRSFTRPRRPRPAPGRPRRATAAS